MGHPVVNGVIAKEDFIEPWQAGRSLRPAPRPITIPPDHWFLLGDNRGASDDSRFLGDRSRPAGSSGESRSSNPLRAAVEPGGQRVGPAAAGRRRSRGSGERDDAWLRSGAAKAAAASPEAPIADM